MAEFRKSGIPFLCLALTQGACAWLFTLVWLYSTTALPLLGTPLRLVKLNAGFVVGTILAQPTRQLVAQNQLNLGAWQSFQEVRLLNPPRELRRLEFEVFLQPGSVFTVFYSRADVARSALRLSLNPDFPSAALTVQPAGRFLDRAPLAGLALQPGWTHVRLEPGSLRVGARELPLPVLGKFGENLAFRNLLEPVSIRDLRGWNGAGQLILHEDFANRHGAGRIFLLALAGLLLVNGVVALASRSARNGVFGALALNLALLGAGVAYYAWDYCVYSTKYPFDSVEVGAGMQKEAKLFLFERARAATAAFLGRMAGVAPPRVRGVNDHFRQWAESVVYYGGEDPFFLPWKTDLAPYAAQGGCRIAVLGTSQTFGSGVSDPANTWIARFYGELVAHHACGGDPRVFNLSIQGVNSDFLRSLYEEYWQKLRPDYLIINLGNNDPDVTRLRSNLAALIALNAAGGGKTILLHEALCHEKHWKWIAEKTAFLDGFRATPGVAVFDLNAFLNQPDIYDSGFLWWDWVHLTSFGQELAGHWLADRFRALPKLAPLAGDVGVSRSAVR